MSRIHTATLLATASVAILAGAHAQAQSVETAQEVAREQHRDRTVEGFQPNHAIGGDIFYSTDADDSEVFKAGANLDWKWKGPDEYFGVRVETAEFKPVGQYDRDSQGSICERPTRPATGTGASMQAPMGDTVLGSATIHNNARFRQEYFIEREVLETP